MGLKERRNLSKVITYALLLAGIAIVFIPFWYMLVTSFKPQAYIFEMPPRLWPQETSLKNYSAALGKDMFGLYFLNSLVVAVTSTALTVLISSLLAYAFARLKFPGKQWLFYLFLMGMMIPPVMLIIPQFIIAKQLGLLDSLWGLVVLMGPAVGRFFGASSCPFPVLAWLW
jgi:multiple sugar transport system permease protein